jgi:alcohol dehydrogenase class IV
VQIPLLEALGCATTGMNDDEAGQRAADFIADFVAELPLPARLRDVGVPQADIPALAEHAAHDPIMLAAAAPVTTDKIAALMQSVW